MPDGRVSPIRPASAVSSEGTRLRKARSMALFEQLDLDATPRRPGHRDVDTNALGERSDSRLSSSTTSSHAGSDAAIAEAVVPMSVYEEVYNDLTKKDGELNALASAHAELQRSHETNGLEAIDREKRRLRQEAEAHRKMIEEERATEREDEKRRRKEVELREQEARAELEGVRKELHKVQEDATRGTTDSTNKVKELELRAVECSTLIEELKKAIAAKDEAHANGAQRAEFESELKARDVELDQVKSQAHRLQAQLDGQRQEYLKEIDELKEAGQETITLYELRLQEAAEESRLAIDDVEDRMRQLQARAQEAIAAAESESARAKTGPRQSTAAAIDNESLQEQVSHLQDKLLHTEDQLTEVQAAIETERAANKKRKDRVAELEAKLKQEVTKHRADHGQQQTALREAREKIEELHEALEERSTALETERAELELLRAEAQGVDGLRERAEPTDAGNVARLTAEVEQLTSLLEGARSGRKDALRQAEEYKKRLDAREEGELSTAKRLSSTSTTSSHRRTSLTTPGSSSRGEDVTSREMTGLRSIVNTLSEENAELRSQLKLQAMRDRSMSSSGMEGILDSDQTSLATGSQALQDALIAARREVEELSTRLAASQTAAKEATNMRREVSEMEALVESMMFEKEDLEARLRRAVKDQRDSRRISSSNEGSDPVSSADRQPTKGDEDLRMNGVDKLTDNEESCDDCGGQHRLEDCPLLDEVSLNQRRGGGVETILLIHYICRGFFWPLPLTLLLFPRSSKTKLDSNFQDDLHRLSPCELLLRICQPRDPFSIARPSFA